MNLTTALNTAMTGLTAAGRSAQVISDNISNALTPGYGRREIDLETAQLGGVRVQGVTRRVDPGLVAERRASGADLGQARTTARGAEALSDILGSPGDSGSIAAITARLQTDLAKAASQPQSVPHLSNAVASAAELAGAFNRASDGVQTIRQKADANIAAGVGALNEALTRVDELNAAIVTADARQADRNALIDARQREIDRISELVPVRELRRDGGAVALVTANGAVLLDDRPAVVGFSRAPTITADMTLGAPLSGLTLNGRPVDMATPDGRMGGGSLQAQFALRDRDAPEMQAALDTLAFDLVTRMTRPSDDATLAPGQPGLFTDGGATVVAGSVRGLSGRLSINAAIDPGQGGEVHRLRDGINATAPGPAGEGRLLDALASGLDVGMPLGGAGARRSLAGHVEDAMSLFGTKATSAQRDEAYFGARNAGLERQALAQGVDTDAEMQSLLLVEKLFGANTKVIQAADAMLQRLLEI